MRICILHLSDLHYREAKDLSNERLSSIANLIRNATDAKTHVIIAISGDLASHGLASEYEGLATRLRQLCVGLGLNPENLQNHFIAIPGNHDCDFSGGTEVRDALLKGIPDSLATLDPRSEIVNSLLAVQDNFFGFLASMRREPIADRLHYDHVVHAGGKILKFQCFNSAWLSRRRDEPAKLGFPPAALPPINVSVSDLTVSLIHHPTHWLNPENGRAVKEILEATSDFILSGHEHTSDAFVVERHSRGNNYYIESGALNEPAHSKSSLGIIDLDLAENVLRHSVYSWLDGAYRRMNSGEPVPFHRNRLLRSRKLALLPQFIATLQEPGTGFTHPRKANLTLQDIYVYPDLRTRQLPGMLGRLSRLPEVLASESVAMSLLDSEATLVVGADEVGKSSLAAQLTFDAYEKYSSFPLLLSGSEFGGKLRTSLERAVEAAIAKQYGPGNVDAYKQLDKDEKVIIIDDWHKVRYDVNGRRQLMAEARRQFKSVILLASDLYVLEQLSDAEKGLGLEDFELCDIREFGNRLTTHLIEKWFFLGREAFEPSSDSIAAFADFERTLETVLDTSFLPRHPVTILTLAQNAESYTKDQDTKTGAYGHLYESLITASLRGQITKETDVGTLYTYLARLAYDMFCRDGAGLDAAHLGLVHAEHTRTYNIRLKLDDVTKKLIDARIMMWREGELCFKYHYIYSYFVARFFQESLAEESESKLRAQLHDIADKIYYEDYANIIVFYIYLTRDRELRDYLLANAQRIYAEYAPFDFDADVEFLNTLQSRQEPLQVTSGDVLANRSQYNEKRDQDATPVSHDTSRAPHAIVYCDELSNMHKLHIALRTLNILGQIVRNFPGVFKGPVKDAIVKEVYLLGLRTTGAMFKLTEANADDLRVHFAEMVRSRMAVNDEEEVKDVSDKTLTLLMRRVAVGMVRRMAQSVGLLELQDTFANVLSEAGEPLPFRIIDLTIKLDYARALPRRDLEVTREIVESNVFTYQVLRDIVAINLYLYPRSHDARQWLGSTFGIRLGTLEILGSGNKLLSSGS